MPRTVTAVEEEEDGRALAFRVDVTDAEQVEAVVGRVAAELGPPTALVNNAGVTPTTSSSR
jgi:3-oxoacyl-[acyl-carrier protein] reductase